ncbi:MAG: hypothetical protein BGO51_22065 [Rhodospirillales bacterium 69-11]|nr:MAG: hypothetical protein BGO51_22065 [Rhodospirillales bacterium 69-11]
MFDNWQPLTANEIARVIRETFKAHPTPSTAVSWRALPFYRDGRLLRITADEMRSVALYLVQTSDGYAPLDGSVLQVDGANHHAGLNINRDSVLEYAKFHGFFVRGPDGPFFVCGETERAVLCKLNGLTEDKRAHLIRDPEVIGEKDDVFMLRAVMLYGGAIFATTLRVCRCGVVEMVEDVPLGYDCLAVHLPITPDEVPDAVH